MNNQTLFIAVNNQSYLQTIYKAYLTQHDRERFDWKLVTCIQEVTYQMGDLIIADRIFFSTLSPQLKRATILLTDPMTKEEMRTFFLAGCLDVIEIHQMDKLFCQLKTLGASRKLEVIARRHRQLRISLAYELLFGQITSPREIWMRSQDCGLSKMPNTVFIVHIDHFHKLVRHRSKKWKWELRNDVMCEIRRHFKVAEQEVIIIPVAPEKVAILYASPLALNDKEYEYHAMEVAEKCKNHLFDHTMCSVTIGIGRCYEDARNIQLSFEEAMKAQENRFFLGNNTVIHYNQVNEENHDEILFDFNEASFLSKLKACNFRAIENELADLENQLFTKRNTQPQLLRIQMNDLLSTLARSAIQSGANKENILRIYEETQQHIRIFENVEEARTLFSTVSTQFMNEVMINRSEKSMRSIQKAVQYIEENYEHPITLEEIAEHVRLSANYFSNLFKKDTDMTFVDYLTHKRIEKSKELLMDLDYTVYQIAAKVGYGDARYFSRVFKSVVGQTPTQYRNSKIGKSV